MRTALFLLFVISFTLLAQPLAAQPAQDGPLWAMSFWKMKLETLPEWRRLVKQVWNRDNDALKKAGLIEDHATFTHDYGSEWNLLTFTRFKDYAAVDALDEQADAITRKYSPDTVATAALGRALRSHVIEHYDSFVRPIAGTSLNVATVPGENSLWVFSSYRIKMGHTDDLEKWLTDNWKQTDEELKKEGTIQDFCYLLHDYGSDWNFIRVVKVKGYADIDKIQKRSQEINTKRTPDAAERQTKGRMFSDMVFAHFDSFMRQMGQ